MSTGSQPAHATDQVAELVIAMLADENAALLERVASLEADREVYRLLSLVAFDVVQDLTQRNRALVSTRAQMRDDVLKELWAAQQAAVEQSMADDEAPR